VSALTWAVVIVWIVAVAFGVVVLGFCAYELRWKALRLRDDLHRLRSLEAPARQLAAELSAAQQRLIAARAMTGEQS
jgi:hypothetical protein